MTVGELMDALSRLDRELDVVASVSWDGDTAESDDVEIVTDEVSGTVLIQGFLEGCDTVLEYA